MKKRIIITGIIFMTMIMTMIIISDRYAVSAKTKRKTYPEVDTKCDNYKYVTDFPEIIMSTTGEENGLIGNCYTITGTVKGVYSSTNKAIKALGRKDAIKNSESDYKMKCIIVKTAKGYVLVHDNYSAVYNELKELFGETLVNEYYKGKGYSFKKYKEYPKKGEKVTILATYVGYSSVADVPAFNYGISSEVVSITKGDNNESSKNDEELLYDYNNITFEYPKSWDYTTVNENNSNVVYFYPYGGSYGMMMLYSGYNSYGNMYQYEADKLVEDLGNSFPDFKITASKKNEYKGKKIDTYYIYSFKCSINKQKYKGRITLFTYKYRDYAFIYLCPNDSSKKDTLFEDYTEIIKSIKTK